MSDVPRILIVDDEAAHAEMVREMLRCSGVYAAAAVDLAASYERAIAALQAQPYEVALFDYRLGSKDGLALLRDIRRRGIDTAVVMLTGHGAEDIAVQAMRAGAADYLNKAQLTVETLHSAVRHALALREEERQRRQAEAALRASEERFRALVENSSDSLLLVDGVGRLLYVAASTQRRLGWSAAEATGRSLLDFLHADDRAIFALRLGEALKHPGEPVAQEIRLRHADGEWRTVEAILVNRLEEPSVRAVVINARDLTDRRRLEEALRQAQKMEAVGQLAGGVAHDFNNLLTAILGYCSLIFEELPLQHPLRSDLGEIQAAGERAAAVTRQLLAFSRRQMLQPQIVDLNELVGQLEKLLKRAAAGAIELSVRLDERIAPVRVDPSSIEQVIINLAVNAKEAMPSGGSLTIETANVEVADTPEARSSPQTSPPPGPYVRLSVTDTGEGMTEETRAHVFEPFFTTKRPGRGNGLGLATVYGIVKQNGGYIFVTSDPGRGAAFHVYLHPVRVRAEWSGSVGRHALQTVLLADEDDAVRALEREVLQRQGYVVLDARNAPDALRMAERHTGAIHVLVASTKLRHMSGADLAARLSERHPALKTILTSGPMHPDALTAAVRDGLAAVSTESTEFH
ncbi:MAG TPA: response regulator [Vicinamibacterales bacterium]|nr:response regulator [Vicinamibacterales bacterium]